jgi:putative transposase
MVENTFSPKTIQAWHRELIGSKYDSSKVPGDKRGRKPVSEEIVQNVLRLPGNMDWGYDRIASYMKYLGFDVSATTVKNILDDYGITPVPEKCGRGDWELFMNAHRDVILSADFASIELVKPDGLVRTHVLFFEDISTREVRLGGICLEPDAEWLEGLTTELCNNKDSFLHGKKFMIHDRGSVFTGKFHKILKSAGIRGKRLPPRSPDLNGHIESFIKTFKKECINKLILTSEAQLRYCVDEFLIWYNRERPHSGLNGKMINPWLQDADGEIVEFSRLGGLLKSYRRIKQAA